MNDLSTWRVAGARRSASAAPAVGALLLALLVKTIRALERRRRRAAAIAELMQLDDKTLADIGLHRSEIRSAVLYAEQTGAPDRRRCR